MRYRDLLEGPNSLKLFCDMDGVLSNFEFGVVKAYFEKTGIRKSFNQISKSDIWRTINWAGEGWWASLPWQPGGKQLWNFIKKYKPIILTASSRQKFCVQEKEEWVLKHLGSNITVICESKKWKYASPYSVLIDDKLERNIIPWEEHGGIGIWHQNTPITIKKLKKLGFK